MKTKTLFALTATTVLVVFLATGCVTSRAVEDGYGIGTYEFWRPLIMVTVVLLVVALAFSDGEVSEAPGKSEKPL